MKWLTVYPRMGCNSFCVYCTSRAIDDQLVDRRQALGLQTPAAPRRRFTSKLLEGIQSHPEPHEKENVVKPAEDLTSEDATRILQERRQRGYTALRFEGGEPTLWEPLP